MISRRKFRITRLAVVCDEQGEECLYINGKRWAHTGETTVHACDLAEAAGDNMVLLTHQNVDERYGGDAWPECWDVMDGWCD